MKCLVCGTELTGNKNKKKYCSLKCRSKDYYSKYYKHFEWKKERICEMCLKPYIPTSSNTKFCSKACFVLKHNNTRNRRRAEKRGIKSCKWCKKDFLPVRTDQRFCSEKCQILDYCGRTGVKNPGYSGTIHKCVICGNEYKARIPQQKYCSKRCNRKADYQKNWKRKVIAVHVRKARKKNGGGSFTPEQWENLKKNSGFRCAWCKKQEPEIKLTIDHIIPICKWSEWSKNNHPSYGLSDIQNIQPLCLKCNNLKRASIM